MLIIDARTNASLDWAQPVELILGQDYPFPATTGELERVWANTVLKVLNFE